MSRTSCLNSERALHDRRLRRKMTGWEFRDFFFTLWFASAECRDPAFIPARKMEDLAMELGMTGQHGKERFAQRLEKWSALDLVQTEEDGGLQINFVMDQEEEEEDAPVYASYAPSINSQSMNGNGGGTNGNGSSGNGHTPLRQPRKSYSSNPDAERKREQRKNKKMQQDGYSQGGTFLQNVPENVPPAESKCPDFLPSVSPEMSQENGTLGGTSSRDIAGTSRARNVQNVVGGLKDSYHSEYVSNVAERENVPPNVPARNVPGNAPAQNVPVLPAATVKAVPPPPRPALHPSEVPAVRQSDVRFVMQETHDDPQWKPQWMRLWKHCHEQELLRCWDEGFALFLYRAKVSPLSGPGSIRTPSKWLRKTIIALLASAGRPYITQAEAQAEAAAEEPVDDEEMAEIHRMVAETKAQWDKEAEASSAVITPLSDIMPESDMPEMEDE